MTVKPALLFRREVERGGRHVATMTASSWHRHLHKWQRVSREGAKPRRKEFSLPRTG